MKKFIRPSFRLLAVSMLLAVFLYVPYIIYRASHFMPDGDVSVYVPIYIPEYHPEEEVQLYLGAVAFVPLTGLLIYFLLKKLIGQSLLYVEKLIDWTVVAVTSLTSLFIVSIILFKFDLVNTFLARLLAQENYIFFSGFSAFTLILASFLSAGFLMLLFYKGKIQYLLDIVSVFAIIFFVSIVATNGAVNSSFVITNYSPIVGPVNDVLGGKTLLVNINSQYGLFIIYALAALFKIIPLTYENFFWLNWATTVIAYLTLYFIMRKWLGKIALFGIFLILLHHYFGGNINILLTCQQTFIRWGWWIILLGYCLFTSSFRSPSRMKFAGELILLGIAFFWGFDTGVYTLGAYLVFATVRIFIKERETRDKILDIMKTVIAVVVTLLLFYFLISTFTYLRAGVWPDWGRFNVTSGQFMVGFGMLPMPKFGIYWIFLGFYLGVVTYIIYKIFISRQMSQKEQELPLVSFVVVFGILQFTYYVGRSTASYLHTIILPLIVLLCWALRGIRQMPRSLTFYSFSIFTCLFITVVNTVGIANLYGAFGKKVSPSRLKFDEVEKQPEYRQSIDAINTYLDTRGKREAAIVSNKDSFFLVKTKSVNVISSNHLDFFNRITQFEQLGRELLSKNPQVVFTDSENIYPMVPIVQSVFKEKYHLEKNVGYLDKWVRNE